MHETRFALSRGRPRAVAAAALLALLLAPARGGAQELGMTGAQFTEVVDAFDQGDPFDFHLNLAYEYANNKTDIERECYAGSCTTSIWNDFIATQKLLTAVDVSHMLRITGLIGLFHDLQLRVELPIYVQRSSSLDLADGVTPAAAATILADPVTGAPLFSAPFHSTNRSGIDYFVTGLEWAVFNQARNANLPTWSLFIEGWWGVGKIMKPSGHDDGGAKYGAEATGGSPGISRGNLSLHAGTRLGKRFTYLNPYFGFDFLAEFPKREAPYPYNNEAVYDGQVNIKPPMKGTITFGLEIVPYEVPARQQKLFIDLRFVGGYVSEGRDFSPLFDALGTTGSPSLDYGKGDSLCWNAAGSAYGPCATGQASDFWEREVGNKDFTKLWKERYDGRGNGSELWTGLSDIENYATYGGRLTVGFVTSKWFKVLAGVGLTYQQPHFITFADQCNSGVFQVYPDGSSNCVLGEHESGTSSFNPDYRAAIDEPGNRFKISSNLLVDVFVHASAMF